MDKFTRTVKGVVLTKVAVAAAFLVHEKVLAPEAYQKCLLLWIKKNAEDDEVLKVVATTMLSYATIIKDQQQNPNSLTNIKEPK